MALADLAEPWSGRVYRHIARAVPPAPSPNILDVRYAGRGRTNRWNDAGEPTLYLARDAALCALEFFRHIDEDRDPGLIPDVIERDVYWLDVVVPRVLDVQRPELLDALSLNDAPTCFLNLQVARSTARRIRYEGDAVQGILVPSVACLDQPKRGSLVFFLERLPADLQQFIPCHGRHGTFRVCPPDSGSASTC